MEDLALDRAVLEDGALGCLELVETSREERPEAGRDVDVAVRLASQRHHLGQEERVPAGCASDPRAQVVIECLR